MVCGCSSTIESHLHTLAIPLRIQQVAPLHIYDNTGLLIRADIFKNLYLNVEASPPSPSHFVTWELWTSAVEG